MADAINNQSYYLQKILENQLPLALWTLEYR